MGAKEALEEFWSEDAEEERVVAGSEKEAARNLGQGTRKSYIDVKAVFKAASVNSTLSGTPTKKEQRQINKTNKRLQ